MKKINNALVEEYIKEKIALEKQQVKVASLQIKLRKAGELGAEHPMLRFQENKSWRPDWKKLVHEMAEQYMTVGARSVFFNRTLKRRFKATKGKLKISILSPRYEAFHETILTAKKKLGLVSVED